MNNAISVYELLGLIKDGKAPHSILFKNEVWFWGYDTYTAFECLNKTPDAQISLFSKYRIDYCLNDKVEIIDKEENKPIIEKLYIGKNDITYDDGAIDNDELVDNFIDVKDKLNEVISYINRKEDK